MSAAALLLAAALASATPDFRPAYARPHEAVDIGGRRLNLFCMGQGPRTVLFDAGGSDWSDVWALVQPQVAKTARACAYDRAGLGHSDPAPLPRTPAEIAQDLHALVVAARLQTPLVVVGHSMGGFNVKLYAALYPEEVAGLVLIDPAEERAAERARMRLRARFGRSLAARAELADQTFLAWLTERYASCAAATRDAPLEVGSPTYRRCTDPVREVLGPEVAAERARIQPTRAYQQAQASEILHGVYADDRADPVYRDLFRPGVFGRRPMIVLSHGLYDEADPLEVAGQASGLALHEETARLSRAGRHRVVPQTTHYIELDAPDAVTGAISEVLSALAAP